MRAAVVRKYKEPLEILDLNLAPPKEGEVKIRVVATGVCHSDVNVVEGNTPIPPPVVPGHEIAGVVEEVGPGVTRVKRGDRVVSAFVFPCGKCRNCVSGRENYCETATAVRLKGALLDGTTRLSMKDGTEVRHFLGAGFAEFSIVPENALTVVTDGVEMEKAAVLGCAGITAYGAVNTARLEPGENVVVLGVGGVGLSMIQMLRAAGAGRIIAVGRKKWKLDRAMEFGATDIVNTEEKDPVKAVREMINGADVVIEAAGSSDTIQQSLDMVRPGGRIVSVGLTPLTQTTPIPFAKVVRSGIEIKGSYGGRPRVDMPRLMQLVKTGRYEPGKLITGRYKLEEINEAIHLLERGEAIRSLIVM